MRFFLIMALNMQTTIIVYWVYVLTHDVATVGLLGLFEAVPAIGFSLFSGYFVDRHEKRSIILFCVFAYLLLSAGYLSLSATSMASLPFETVHLIYAGIFLGGSLRAFFSPSAFSLVGLLVPRKHYANAGTWNSTSWQMGAIAGPLLAGFLIAAIGISASLGVALCFILVALVLIWRIPKQVILSKEKEPILESLREGLRFVFRTQIILAALALDMFAVLFGGATALLPAFVHTVLKLPPGTEEIAFGWLRAAPGIGAVITFFVIANKPLKTRPGPKLLFCVAGFGASIIVFGLSKSFILSMAMLILSGAFDAVSVVIRGTILQVYTPDAVRGRVSAVNTMFVSSSNELGEVESGFTAKWMGTVPAVIFGGCMTIIVAGITWFSTPKMRSLKLEPPEET
ncbi:MAG: MFS transporter [Bacteroidetes bacterium]|nr:MFS transporter [Bacteroidota bacterium]MBS1629258.1 MFS transporter [Bacteroidota bacterium]